MSPFVTLGVVAILLAGAGWRLYVKIKPDHTTAIEIASHCLFAALLFGGLIVATQAQSYGNQSVDGINGSVVGTGLNPAGQTVLTVEFGELKKHTKITCLPEQLACQGAQLGDLVVYDKQVDASGWIEHRQIGYITAGPPR